MLSKEEKKVSISFIKKELSKYLSKERLKHVEGVEVFGLLLALKYNADLYKVAVAALLHDIAKDMTLPLMKTLINKANIEMDSYFIKHTDLWHGPVGAYIAKSKFDISDEEILSAIKYHSTGKPNMSLVEQIIFVADYCEPNRKFMNVDKMRDIALKNINKATLAILCLKQDYLTSIGVTPHPISLEAITFYKKILNRNGEK